MSHDELVKEACAFPKDVKLWANDRWCEQVSAEKYETWTRITFKTKAKKDTGQWFLELIYNHELIREESVCEWTSAGQEVTFQMDIVKPVTRD